MRHILHHLEPSQVSHIQLQILNHSNPVKGWQMHHLLWSCPCLGGRGQKKEVEEAIVCHGCCLIVQVQWLINQDPDVLHCFDWGMYVLSRGARMCTSWVFKKNLSLPTSITLDIPRLHLSQQLFIQEWISVGVVTLATSAENELHNHMSWSRNIKEN